MRAAMVVVVTTVAVAVACLRTVGYQCSNDSFCVRDGVQGTCETTSFCSFPDPMCPSGKRYGSAGPSANACVDTMLDGGMGSDGGPSGFTIGGVASGASGSGLELRDNASDMLAVPTNGPFTFAQRLATGSAYDVIVLSPPASQQCAVVNGAGTVAGANVTNVQVHCANGGPGVACGGAVCAPLSTEDCCHGKTDATGSCALISAGCTGNEVDERCDDAADCGGLPKICCAHLTSTGTIKSTINCQNSTGNCTAMGTDTVQYLCDPAAATPCPGTMACVADVMHGWHYCK